MTAFAALPADRLPTLADLQAPVAAELAAVEQRLAETVASAPHLLGPLAEQLVPGGKRLRPLVLLLSAWGESGIPAPAVDLAVAVEQIHFASLTHDDVIDGALERRGSPSAPQLLGSRRAVLAGDYLAAITYRSLVEAQVEQAVAQALSEAMLEMTLAEARSVAQAGLLPQEAEYLEIIAGKTAALFRAAATMGALADEKPAEQVAALQQYGQRLGMAFQIRDDLLDLYGDGRQLGKPVGRDIRAGVYTLPLIHAAAQPGSERLRELLDQARASTVDADAIVEAVELSRSLGGEGYAAERAAEYAREAQAALPETPARAHLASLTQWILGRNS